MFTVTYDTSDEKLLRAIEIIKDVCDSNDKVYKKRLTPHTRCDIISELSRTACGLVAQLDRVFDYESKGRGFESRRAHQ